MKSPPLSPHGKAYPEYPSWASFVFVSKDDPYMRQAYDYAKKIQMSTSQLWPLLSALIVRDREVLSRGISGDGWHQREGRCIRIEQKYPVGEGYESCPGCQSAHHAEATAIKHAKADGIDVRGADLYLYGHWWCCTPCWTAMRDAGIRRVYLRDDADIVFDRRDPGCIIGTPAQFAD